MKKRIYKKRRLFPIRVIRGYQFAVYLLVFLNILFGREAQAQNVRGDTVHVNTTSIVVIGFPSSPEKANLFFADGEEGSYEVSDIGKKTLSIKALKKEVRNQLLEVSEGGRRHLFILSYNESSPARTIDLSTKRKLSARAEETRNEVLNRLNATNLLYEHARNSVNNQALWENVESNYLKLATIVEAKDAILVQNRVEESQKNLRLIVEQKYREAMTEGQNRFFSKKYPESKNAFMNALSHKPGDTHALKSYALVDSVWAKDFVDKGDEAYKAKNYVLAKASYQTALTIRPQWPSLKNKYLQAKNDADPVIYSLEREKADRALKARDVKEAKRGYDSALSVKPGDKYVQSQLKILQIEMQKIEEEERVESEYQGILATAKQLAEKASSPGGYDLAIREYQRALRMLPNRKFPTKRINELKTRKAWP